MPESILCKICGAGFREEALQEGKCDLCFKLFPKANSLKDIKNSKSPQDKLNDGNLHKVIIEKIYNVLDNLGILAKCSCGKKYYKRSPAQKTCGTCPKTVLVTKETN